MSPSRVNNNAITAGKVITVHLKGGKKFWIGKVEKIQEGNIFLTDYSDTYGKRDGTLEIDGESVAAIGRNKE